VYVEAVPVYYGVDIRQQLLHSSMAARHGGLAIVLGPRPEWPRAYARGRLRVQRLTDTDLAGERGCILSDYGAYPYRLRRERDKSCPTLVFLMLNPSTADHLTDDPTRTVQYTDAIPGGRCLKRRCTQ
jgi:Protein of unknown function (DUF1643)